MDCRTHEEALSYRILNNPCLFVLNVLSWAQDLSGPKLVFKEREFHLQEVMEGTVAEHVFRFFNHGDKPLKILHIKPG